MTNLNRIKQEIRKFQVSDPARESKYGKFLDKMVFDCDLRGSDPTWDLWYYSDNTEFCRDSDASLQLFRDYRNAVMHGYVFPLSMDASGIFIKESPKEEPFRFEGHFRNLLDFCNESFAKVSDFICTGWRCFERDELT